MKRDNPWANKISNLSLRETLTLVLRNYIRTSKHPDNGVCYTKDDVLMIRARRYNNPSNEPGRCEYCGSNDLRDSNCNWCGALLTTKTGGDK